MSQSDNGTTATSTDVPLRLRLTKDLYAQLVAFRKEIGATNDQNAIRIALTLFLAGKKR